MEDTASDTTTWTHGQAGFSQRTKTVTQVTHWPRSFRLIAFLIIYIPAFQYLIPIFPYWWKELVDVAPKLTLEFWHLCSKQWSYDVFQQCSQVTRWHVPHKFFLEVQCNVLYRKWNFSPKIILSHHDIELFISMWTWGKSPMEIHYIYSLLNDPLLLLF